VPQQHRTNQFTATHNRLAGLQAFKYYRYRNKLSPTICFRMVYDDIEQSIPRRAH